MRTSIFNNFTDLERDFSEDFKLLWTISKEQRAALIPKSVLLFKARTTVDSKRIMDQAVSEIGGNTANVLKCLRLLRFIFRAWNPVSDTPENFIKDLNELDLLPEAEIEDAEEFLMDFFSHVQDDNDRRLQKLYANSILPSFKGFSTLVDFRAVISNPFASDLNDDYHSYEPRCIGFTPVIIAQIRTDSSQSPYINMQLEEEDIQYLIEALNATLKDLNSAKQSLPGGRK